MMVNWKKYLIFFIITLICSITPAIAIQTGETNNTTNDINTAWKEGLEHAVDIMNQDDTELTPEQRAYLETHLDDVQTNGETVLNNLQNYMNFVTQEFSKHNNTKKSRNNFGDDSVDEIIYALRNHVKLDNATYTYTELTRRVNLPSTNESYVNESKVIVQMRDGLANYVVYAELTNITEKTISIKTKKVNETWDAEEFKNHHTTDGNLNVIIVPRDVEIIYIQI